MFLKQCFNIVQIFVLIHAAFTDVLMQKACASGLQTEMPVDCLPKWK
jgi:hypothetical protein